jgi:hypothetical protein
VSSSESFLLFRHEGVAQIDAAPILAKLGCGISKNSQECTWLPFRMRGMLDRGYQTDKQLVSTARTRCAVPNAQNRSALGIDHSARLRAKRFGEVTP